VDGPSPTPFELSVDDPWLWSNSEPFKAFNHVRLVDGRAIDFDTWLEVQRRSHRRRRAARGRRRAGSL